MRRKRTVVTGSRVRVEVPKSPPEPARVLLPERTVQAQFAPQGLVGLRTADILAEDGDRRITG